jgi:hypothetical protein
MSWNNYIVWHRWFCSMMASMHVFSVFCLGCNMNAFIIYDECPCFKNKTGLRHTIHTHHFLSKDTQDCLESVHISTFLGLNYVINKKYYISVDFFSKLLLWVSWYFIWFRLSLYIWQMRKTFNLFFNWRWREILIQCKSWSVWIVLLFNIY